MFFKFWWLFAVWFGRLGAFLGLKWVCLLLVLRLFFRFVFVAYLFDRLGLFLLLLAVCLVWFVVFVCGVDVLLLRFICGMLLLWTYICVIYYWLVCLVMMFAGCLGNDVLSGLNLV